MLERDSSVEMMCDMSIVSVILIAADGKLMATLTHFGDCGQCSRLEFCCASGAM